MLASKDTVGKVENMDFYLYSSPIGEIYLYANDTALVGLYFAEQSNQPDRALFRERLMPPIQQAVAWLNLYFSGEVPNFTPPLSFSTTPFRAEIYRLLLTVPYGTTTTYKALAEQYCRVTGKKRMSAQAVGGAVGSNPISLIVPCHRVVGTDGGLTGYAGGLERKAVLLRHEKNK